MSRNKQLSRTLFRLPFVDSLNFSISRLVKQGKLFAKFIRDFAVGIANRAHNSIYIGFRAVDNVLDTRSSKTQGAQITGIS